MTFCGPGRTDVENLVCMKIGGVVRKIIEVGKFYVGRSEVGIFSFKFESSERS